MPTSKWFCEKSVPGKREGAVKHCFTIDKPVFEGKTKFQKVLIFDNDLYGRMLFLNGISQLSQSDEFIYHEMMVHPALLSHPNPKNVLVIGGGDGCILREVLKHDVKKIDLVELDGELVELSKKHLSSLNKKAFSDKRVEIHIQPGQEFIKKFINFYDVVIIDCTNLEEKAISSPLYGREFYEKALKAMTTNGMLITLGSSFLDVKTIMKTIFKGIEAAFPYTAIYRFTVPSYHCGEYSFVAGSKKINLEKPDFKRIQEKFGKLSQKHEFRYYSPEMHKASMVMPEAYKVK